TGDTQDVHPFPTRRSSDLRKSGYAALRRMAERLAAAGHAALRFDYRGSGESGGDPAKRCWQNLAEDCAMARKVLARLSGKRDARSEEHTSELQSLRHLVCR